jgi:Ankyrin repeats (many copies)
MIENDPKRHMYSKESMYHIVNRWNTHRQSPLYVAAKHGHLDMVHYLI